MAKDPRTSGLVLAAKSARGGFAAATSLRGLILRARASGKQVVVHLPLGGGTKEAYFAVAGDRLLLGPQAPLAPVGVLASTRYVRGALDRVGIVPEVYARGRYKTAAESLERTSMSEPQREQLDVVLDGLHRELVHAIRDGRRVDEERARAIVDGAPYVGDQASAAGLVDGVAYEDELRKKLTTDGAVPRLVPGDRYQRARSALRPGALQSLAAIGVIPVHGIITGPGGLALRATAVDERVMAAVRRARMNPLIRGVILHVDSPGGAALASDRIHRELVRLAAEKPLVASMGSVAASGGYYVAVAAHEIVAQPTTITGSIGVVSGRIVLEPLFRRRGIATEVLQRGVHARFLDPFLPLDESGRQALSREIDSIYDAFVKVVAFGRNRPVAEIEGLAQGRVWTGADAQRNGLVDRLGGFDAALDSIRNRIGPGAKNLRVVVLQPPRKPFSSFEATAGDAAHMSFLEPLLNAVTVDVAMLALGRERVLAWSPAAASVTS
jgi:protease-4